MSGHQEIRVPAEATGQRLDQFLATALKRSRADIQRKIDRGEIRIDGAVAKRDLRLESEWRISVATDKPPEPPTEAPLPRLVDEDDDVLVIDKPAGLTVHPAPSVREQTLVDWLRGHCPAITGVGEDPDRPGLVHRLDREASGLMVIAKTQRSFEALKRAFQEHRVQKRYIALVHGQPANESGEVRFPIDRSERDGAMAAKPAGAGGREAITRFTVLKRLPPFTLVEVETETGRTHQVRVHLQAIGHPIAGDPLYHPKKLQTRKSPPRLFLHATRLSFPDRSGQLRLYESSLPPDLQDYLTGLRYA